MAASPSSELQQKRLLRMTIAHYRKEDCAEEDFYRWATEVYTPQAVKILTKHGLEAFQYVRVLSSFRWRSFFFLALREPPANALSQDN